MPDSEEPTETFSTFPFEQKIFLFAFGKTISTETRNVQGANQAI